MKKSTDKLGSIPEEEFRRCFRKWQKRWEKCVYRQGNTLKEMNKTCKIRCVVCFIQKCWILFEQTSYMFFSSNAFVTFSIITVRALFVECFFLKPN